MADFVFHINEVGEGNGHFSWPVTSGWVRAAFSAEQVEPARDGEVGKLALDALKNGDELLLRGRLTAAVHTPCVRCLGDAAIDVDAELVGLLALPSAHRRGASPAAHRRGNSAGRRADAAVADDEDQDETRLDAAMVVGDSVHLDDWVREHIVLEVPMRPVCGDDCNGLEVPAHIRPPEDFGAEHDVDPRLLPLLKLKDQIPSKKE